MRMHTLIAATLFLGSFAFAENTEYMAALAQPVVAKTSILANGNIFGCMESTCRLVSTPQDASTMRTCRELRRQVGELTSYGSTSKPFDTDRLAKCNAK